MISFWVGQQRYAGFGLRTHRGVTQALGELLRIVYFRQFCKEGPTVNSCSLIVLASWSDVAVQTKVQKEHKAILMLIRHHPQCFPNWQNS